MSLRRHSASAFRFNSEIMAARKMILDQEAFQTFFDSYVEELRRGGLKPKTNVPGRAAGNPVLLNSALLCSVVRPTALVTAADCYTYYLLCSCPSPPPQPRCSPSITTSYPARTRSACIVSLLSLLIRRISSNHVIISSGTLFTHSTPSGQASHLPNCLSGRGGVFRKGAKGYSYPFGRDKAW
jgi:hypothetical protein